MNTAVPQAEEFVAPSHWRTVDFLSDLHLQAAEPGTLACFERYLTSAQADAVFILGDLFEVWVGDDACNEAGSFEARLAQTLAAAALRRPVYFMHGNRDFLVGDSLFKRTGIVGLSDPTLLIFRGQHLLLSHGDLLCLDDVDYQRFRRLARSSAWQQQFLAQPLDTRRALARDIRTQSEAHKRSGAPYADVNDPAALTWLQAAGAHTLVHGHTHRPAEHVLAPGYRRLVLSDWDACAQPPRADVLRATGKGLERIRIDPM